jgi:hypothetical protein
MRTMVRFRPAGIVPNLKCRTHAGFEKEGATVTSLIHHGPRSVSANLRARRALITTAAKAMR